MIFYLLLLSSFHGFASVSGFLEELKGLNQPTKGCVSNSHSSFRTIDEMSNCLSEEEKELTDLKEIGVNLTEISRLTYLRRNAQNYKALLGESYKEIFPLNQFLQGRTPPSEQIESQIELLYQNYSLLFEIEKHQQDERDLIGKLKCEDPRVGDWKSRHEICQSLRKNSASRNLESIKASVYAEFPFLYHPSLRVFQAENLPQKSEFKTQLKIAMSDFTKNLSEEISDINQLLTNEKELKKLSHPQPGPGSDLSPKDWEILSRIMNNSQLKYEKGNEKFSYADCLFHEDLLNHEKLLGVDLFKKNVALSLVSLGLGAAAARFGTLAKTIATLTPTAVGIAAIDYPEIRETKEKCKSLEKGMSFVKTDSKEWSKKRDELNQCQTNLKFALLAACLGPISDAVSLARPTLRSLNISYDKKGFSERLSRIQVASPPSVPKSIPEVKVSTSPKMSHFQDYSQQLRESLENPQLFMKRYGLSEDAFNKITDKRKLADKKIIDKITSREYLDEDLTQRGYEKYASMEEYEKSFKGFPTEGLSTTELMRQTKTYFHRVKNGEVIFEAMFKAMKDRGSMIEWQSSLHDDLLHRLLISKNTDWIESFHQTGRFPRQLLEDSLLERASLYGWPKEFTDLDGGVLSSKDFGKKVAMGKFLREKDLDEVAYQVAKKDVITDKGVQEKILKGELKHGELTHAAHMDYMIYLAQKGKLGPLRPEDLRGFIQRLGEAMQYNEPGLKDAWSLLFDGTAQGKTLATPNNFYEVFSQNMDL